ncbi:MAG TPA: glycosyltransferase, partial [Planctomycetota bacterium]|nr:glycosyltransferase [Planctomycetota bacterium]
MDSADENELEALRARLIQLTKENQELRFKNERLERLNKSLLESASWKVTAPLRTVGALVGRATEKLKASPRRAEEDRQRGDPELLEPPEDLASWPALSVVSAVYNKARELPFFLEGFARQSYPGPFEVIVVDDSSKDSTWEILEASRKKWPWLKILRTEKNSGQCRARNMGIEASRGDVIFVMDGDCVVNQGFLRAHAMKHALQDELDIVLGPYNLEIRDRDPWEVLETYEKDPALARLEERQDASRPESFLNCVTRNISIKRRFLEQNQLVGAVYDERFSYTADPNT